jgi:hypothetical protein
MHVAMCSVCQSLIAEHEPEIVQFFFTERDSDLSKAEREICIKIAKLCNEDQFVVMTEPDKSAKAESQGTGTPSEGDDGGKTSAEL